MKLKKFSTFCIINRNLSKKPKKTEILNLFNTFITQEKEKTDLKFKSLNSKISTNRKSFKASQEFSTYIRSHKQNFYSSSNSSFNDNSLTRSTQINNMKYMNNIKYMINRENLKGIRQLILPELKSTHDSVGKMDIKFYLPEQATKLSELSNILTHKKYNSQKFLDIKSNFFINKVFIKDKISKKIILNAIKEEKTRDILEENDLFYDEDLKVKKIKQIILNFLQAKDNKLNQIQIPKPKFFNKLENKVNFLFDAYKVPNIKNNFIDLSNKLFKIYKYPNIIDQGITNYLNILRYTIQNQLDNDRNINNKNEKESEYKNVSHKEIEDEKANYFRFKGNDDRQTTIYELDAFFVHKFTKFKNVKISDWKIKNVIYNAKQTRIELEEEEMENLKKDDKVMFSNYLVFQQEI